MQRIFGFLLLAFIFAGVTSSCYSYRCPGTSRHKSDLPDNFPKHQEPGGYHILDVVLGFFLPGPPSLAPNSLTLTIFFYGHEDDLLDAAHTTPEINSRSETKDFVPSCFHSASTGGGTQKAPREGGA